MLLKTYCLLEVCTGRAGRRLGRAQKLNNLNRTGRAHRPTCWDGPGHATNDIIPEICMWNSNYETV